jgi:hypothetical protein
MKILPRLFYNILFQKTSLVLELCFSGEMCKWYDSFVPPRNEVNNTGVYRTLLVLVAQQSSKE